MKWNNMAAEGGAQHSWGARWSRLGLGGSLTHQASKVHGGGIS